MKMVKQLRLFSTVMVCLCLLLVSAAHSDELRDTDWAGKTCYLGVNIWFERPMKIFTTNYHKGLILNAGEKVKILKVSEKKAMRDMWEGSTTQQSRSSNSFVVFSPIGDTTQYRIIYVRKHHANITMDDILKRTFLSQDPFKSAKYRNFTNKEKEHIKTGTIGMGMSKDAVLMAYGYPPDHRTPSLKNNVWIYWKDRFRSHQIKFDNNGKVKGIQ